ncbi:hypothetical protein HMPREF0322_05152 [Desulfitobacterium hafniense DP7]|uniref:Uncharacterized protein n=1 Tax=Desulfitobacterium hafniense DP7 TaxID=537010 RepID=G9XVW9_DESHA|nr:hypothetical protein [Desulfitobacterium hafniense]EHL04232.1 hypothetical protein HMPREF0322_05152 [Desulfitobacterium hafniense DP7]
MENQENKRRPLTKSERKAVRQHLRKVKRQLYRNLLIAYRGWWYWHKLLKKYKKQGVHNWAVILLPDTNERDNYLALLYLDHMLSQHKFVKALVLTHSETVLKTAGLFSKRIADIVRCSREEAEALMQFYCLYNFDGRFFCASLDEPYGRNGSKLIGARGISAEELFAIGVYRLYPYEQMTPPQYHGGEADIEDFLVRAATAAHEGYAEEETA